MIEELKKKSLKGSLAGSILLIIIGLVLLVWDGKNAFYAVTGYQQFEELAPDQIKNQLVKVNLTANFGCYLEEYEYNKDTNYRRTTDLYYIIWTGDENSQDYRYMSVKVPASMERRMEEMAENSFNQIYSDPIEIYGAIKKLDDEEYRYFKEYFEENEWSEQDIQDGTLPYYIDVIASPASMNGIYIAAFAAGVLLLIVGIFRIIKGATGGYLKKLREDIQSAGFSESMVEADYSRAHSFDKKGTIKMGDMMIYYTSGYIVRAIPNNRIMWVYQNTITHRTNGVKTGTTYNVIIHDEFEQKGRTIAVPNEEVAQKVLGRIDERLPWVVVGYSDDLKTMYNQNRAQFLQIRYNTCEHVATDLGLRDRDMFEKPTI